MTLHVHFYKKKITTIHHKPTHQVVDILGKPSSEFVIQISPL